MEYLQAHIARVKAHEEKAQKEADAKRSRDEFKAKMLASSGSGQPKGRNNSGKAQPAVKKELTL